MELRDENGQTETEFLQQYAKKQYIKPSLTADIVVLSEENGELFVLLIKRGRHPFLGYWALPGGFANPNEPLEKTAARELAEETGAEDLQLQLIGVFSEPKRDPRGWVVSAAFCAQADRKRLLVQAGDDAAAAIWAPIAKLPPLAFDHKKILQSALKIIKPQ